MKKILPLFCLSLALSLTTNFAFGHSVDNLSADQAMKKLAKGNERFVKLKSKHPGESKNRRKLMLKGQHPFVVILSCSDSRVPPELIFDQGLGDIFEIRNAGNVLNEHVIGSIEYAVMHCGVKLIVIMGHQDCGAIAATLSGVSETKYIKALEDSIQPDKIQCLEDGTWHVMLRRYVKRRFNLTPQQYREKWGLPDDYPFVAPAYARKRSKIAKKSGLGRK